MNDVQKKQKMFHRDQNLMDNISIFKTTFEKFSKEKNAHVTATTIERKIRSWFFLGFVIAFKIPDQNKKRERERKQKIYSPCHVVKMLRVFSVCAFIPFASHERHRSHLQHNFFFIFFTSFSPRLLIYCVAAVLWVLLLGTFFSYFL